MNDYAPGYFDNCLCCKVYGPRSVVQEKPTKRTFEVDVSNIPTEQIPEFLRTFNQIKEIEREVEKQNDEQLIKVALEKSLRGLEEKAQQINETREILRDIQEKQRLKEKKKEVKMPVEYPYRSYQKKDLDKSELDKTAFEKAKETEKAMRALETAMADKQEEDKSEQKILDLDKRIDKLESMMINMAMSLTEIRAILTTPPVEEKLAPPVEEKLAPPGPMVHMSEEAIKEAVYGESLSRVKAVGVIDNNGPPTYTPRY